jgi:hypothetical protein
MMPLMPSPGSPKMVSTPQSVNASIMWAAAVFANAFPSYVDYVRARTGRAKPEKTQPGSHKLLGRLDASTRAKPPPRMS